MVPKGVTEIAAPKPLEISGIAAVPGGYALVGDEQGAFGRIVPSGARFNIPGKLKGPESIAVGYRPGGGPLWLVLGEKRRKLVDLDGGRHTFDKSFKEQSGRGLEGVAVRWRQGAWEAAVVWEGGYYDPDSKRAGTADSPKIGLFNWAAGKGCKGKVKTVTLSPPRATTRGHLFRATDLMWEQDHLVVLLESTNAARTTSAHTWLQRFALDGAVIGRPLKLEQLWGAYRRNKQWEALDRTLDGTSLVLGYDAKDDDPNRTIVIFTPPADW